MQARLRQQTRTLNDSSEPLIGTPAGTGAVPIEALSLDLCILSSSWPELRRQALAPFDCAWAAGRDSLACEIGARYVSALSE
eukprot:9249155-Pyramimonas_sp.AAC.1